MTMQKDTSLVGKITASYSFDSKSAERNELAKNCKAQK
jgi:hypothetical protein